MDFSDTVLLRESTKWWIVGAFLLIGTIFLVSRNSSETAPAPDAHASNHSDAKVAQEQKPIAAVSATRSTAGETEKPLVCDAAGCPDCFQKIETAPNSNFAAFDPFLSAAADEEKEVKDEKTKGEDELKQARANLKAVIEEENDDPLLRPGKKTSATEKEQPIVVNAVEAKKEEVKKNVKFLLQFVEKVPLESDEWKKLSVDEKVARYLKMKMTFEPSELSLEEFREAVESAVDIEVTLDTKALEEASYDTATKLAVKSKRPRPLKFLLSETLQAHSIAYSVKNDSLIITSEAKHQEDQITKVYPVVDLVTPATADANEATEPDFESLINLIETTVQPKTWKEVSGDDNGGTLDRYQTTRLLVVRNTFEVHGEIEELFAQLRSIKAPSSRKIEKVADVAPEQPDKIVRRVYYITNAPQVGTSVTGTRNHAVSGGFSGGSMGGVAVGGGGLFCISAERPNTPTPPSLNHPSSYIAQFNSGGRPQPSGFNSGSIGMSPVASDITLSPAQMKARMESLIDIIPATIAPPSWDKEDVSLQSFENRIIVVNTAASQNDVEKLLRGLKVLSRVETW